MPRIAFASIVLTMLTPGVFATLHAAEPAEHRPLFNFHLLPKALQKNPNLEMTVFTEVTDFGRTLPPVSPEHPIRYIAHDSGGASMGESVAGERKPPMEELDAILSQALAKRGYLPFEDGGVPPSLVLIFHWGSHYRMDFDLAVLFPELDRQRVLERAMLVGGHSYQKQVMRQIDYGTLPGDHAFKMGVLYDQANTDLYYAVVSAYDHDSVAAKKPRLAWRTFMTVSAIGVSMSESLPVLVLTASDFFGSDMKEPDAMFRTVRRGTVTMGPLRVIGMATDEETAPSK